MCFYGVHTWFSLDSGLVSMTWISAICPLDDCGTSLCAMSLLVQYVDMAFEIPWLLELDWLCIGGGDHNIETAGKPLFVVIFVAHCGLSWCRDLPEMSTKVLAVVAFLSHNRAMDVLLEFKACIDLREPWECLTVGHRFCGCGVVVVSWLSPQPVVPAPTGKTQNRLAAQVVGPRLWPQLGNWTVK